MKHPTQQQIDSYREHGFVAIPGFLDADELEHWRTSVDAAIAKRGNTPITWVGERPDDAEETYYDKVFTQRVNLWQDNPEIAELVRDPKLGAAAAALAGLDGVRIWHDQALVKQPYANPTGFHLDVPYWSFRTPDSLSVWVALDDATLTNGAMCYIPGSHKAEKYDNVGIGPELDALFKVYPEWADVPPAFCPIEAGGAIFHNGLTAHGAGANMTPGRRRAMTAGFTPLDIRYNGIQNILPPDIVSQLHVGDPIAFDEQNPVVWTRA